MLFFRMLQHLLPSGHAWQAVTDKKLRKLLVGLSSVGKDARDHIDGVWGELSPQSTTLLAEWEREFGLRSDGTTDERIARLAATWQARGGQSPRYLQDIVQAAGFDVYIHEWFTKIRQTGCGDSYALCGRRLAQCAGSSGVVAKNPSDFDADYVKNTVGSYEAAPGTPDHYRSILYWAAEHFPEKALIEPENRAALERLLLKICPAQQWLGVLTDIWTPTDIGADLKLWLRADADNVTKDGSNFVSLWSDQSGNGNDLAQATATKQPLWVSSVAALNNQPAISFDGVDNYLRNAALAGGPYSQPVTIYIVGTWHNNDNVRYLYDGADAGSRIASLTTNSPSAAASYYAGSSVVTSPSAPANNAAFIQRVAYDGANSGGRILTNGAADIVWGGGAGNHALAGLTVGARYSLVQAWNRFIAEILVIEGNNAASEDANLIPYLRAYGVAAA